MNRISSHIIESIKSKAIQINTESGFVDKSWTFIDSINNVTRFLFKDNNRFLEESRGQITEGKWEFIPQWGGVIITIHNNVNFYEQAFVYDDAIMIFKIRDTDEYIFFTNDKKLLPQNIEDYIKKTKTESFTERPPNSKHEDSNLEILIVFVVVTIFISFSILFYSYF